MIGSVFITGGSRGIGRSAVYDFCRLGYKVAFTYNSSEASAISLSEETGALAVRCNLECPEQINSAINTAKSALGNISVLVNNAGMAQIKLFTDITPDEWNKMMNVNINSMYHTSRLVIPDMVSNKFGRIINISSIWGQVGSSCEVHYSTSKAAIIGFTKALSKELAPSFITVNCICPGVIDTDMNAGLSSDVISGLCDEIPMSRLGKPSEVSGLIAFLASSSASYITGQIIGVNGGYCI